MDGITMSWDLGTAGLLLLATAAVAVLLVLIMVFKIHAFVALMMTSIGTALAAGVAPKSLMEALSVGFNSTLGSVMLLVALGAMLGRMLETSGGAQVLADVMIRAVGERAAGIGLSFASLLMGFPIFFDAGLVVMMPIIYAVARRAGGSFLTVALPSAIAFSAMHIFAPPHPGPVAASTLVGANIGLALLVGLIFAVIIYAVVGIGMSMLVGRPFRVEVPTILDGSNQEDHEFASRPSVLVVLGLLFLPLPLILLNTALNTISTVRPQPQVFLDSPLVSVLRMLGETPVALLLTVLAAMLLLGWGAGKKGSLVERVADSALGPICSVVLVTGAGGMFGGVLRLTGIGDAVAGSLQDLGMPVILASYLIAQIVRIAQGSATVSLITAASLMAGVITTGDFNAVQVVALVMAMSAGSVGFSHVNDSGFWLVSRFFGLDMKQTLATWTVLQGMMALVGFALSVVLFLLASLI